jgi:metal-responsive CopG/Arc/MetJ family transcriptional regulator
MILLIFGYMSRRLKGYGRVSITLPTRVLRNIDDLADEVGLSRSEVIADLCEYCLDNKEIIDEIYPFEEEEEED